MQRREFLLSASALALSGCVPPALRNMSDGANGNTVARTKIIGGSWEENSRIARGIFQAAQAGRVPLSQEGVPFAAMHARNNFFAVADSMPSTWGYANALNYSGALTSYFADTMQARKAFMSSNNTTARSGGDISLGSGNYFVFTEKGYCMDEGLPAPGSGELMRLVPANDMVPKELQGLWNGLLSKVSKPGPDMERYRHRIQQMLWMVRSNAGNNQWAYYRPDPQLRSLMDGAYPNGYSVWESYIRRNASEAKAKADMANVFSRMAGMGDRYSASDFTGTEGQRFTDARMRTSLSTPVTGAVVPGSEYSMIAPGVAARVVGTNQLEARIELLNVGGQPFAYEPTAWASETQRQAQRVAFSGNIQGAQSSALKGYSAAQRAEADKDIGEALQGDLAKKQAEKLAEFGPKLLAYRGLFKAGADMMPLVGNALSLYEGASGKDWMTGEVLSPASRALALAATMPGANVLKALGAARANSIMGQIAKKASSSAFPTLADRTESLRSAMDWGLSDSAGAVMDRVKGEPAYQRAVATASELFSSFA